MKQISKPYMGNFKLGQPFGANEADFYKKDGLLGHTGQDIPMPTGTPVIAPFSGTISGLSTDLQQGEGVTVMSDDIFQWNGQDCKLLCVLWHLKDQSILVKMGDHVVTGQSLGLSNNTGQSTGPHLHISIIPIATDGSRRSLAGIGNGYKGAVDPVPYFDWSFDPSQKFKELQTFLNNHGANIAVDGKFGKLSNQALQTFLNS